MDRHSDSQVSHDRAEGLARRLARTEAALQEAIAERADAELLQLHEELREATVELQQQNAELTANQKGLGPARLLDQILRDREEVQNLAAALARERDILEVIMGNTDTCLAYLDPQFNIVRVNSAYVEKSGYTREELLGRDHFDLFPHEENQAIFERVRDTSEAISFRAKPFEYPYQPERGVTYWDWILVPVKDAAGEVQGLVLSLQDVTQTVEAQQALQKERDRAQTYLDIAGAIIVAIASDQIVTLINRHGCGVLEVEEGEIVGKNWFDTFVPEREREKVKAAFDLLLAGEVEAAEQFENPVLTRSGEERLIAWQNAVLRDEMGRIVGILSSGQDITEPRQADEALHGLAYNLNKRVKELNSLYCMTDLVETPGISLEEIVQGTVDLMPPAWQYPEVACARIVLEGREFRSKDLAACPWQQAADILIHGKPSGTVQVGYLQERPQVDEGPFLEEERGLLNAIARRVGRIAERMRARQQLLEWNRFLQAVLDSLDYPFYVVNVRDWTVELANSAAYEGQSRGERTCFSLMHGRNRPCELEGSRCPLQEVVRTRRPVIVEHVHLAGDGTSRNVEVRGYPILDPQGRVVQMIEYILDITERKQAEQALRESEGRWRSLTETSPDNVLMLDTDLKIQFANYASPGLTVDELIGTPLYTLVDEARQAEIKGILEDVLRTGSSARYETVYHLPDGDDVTYESRAVARTLSGSEEVVGLTLSARDITDRKRAEAVLRQARDELELRVQERTAELVELNRGLLAEVAERRRAEQELRASEERFRQLAENVDDVIWLMEPESGRLLYISPAYEKVWGRPIPSQPEKIGSLLADVHPEDMALMPRNLAEVGTGEEIEFRLVRPHGDVRWIRARLFPVCDETGQIYRFVGIAADTTIQKKTQAALIEAERLAIAGRMAASLTHEISNPLQAAIGCLDLSLEQLDRGEDPHRHLQVTASALGRASRVVAQLRALHYPSDVEGKEVVDLNALLESVLVLVQKRCLDQSVEVIWQAEPDLPPVPLMPDAIQQLFLNLALNALDAMPQEGRLEVGARPTQEPPGILVSFTDTGCGIPADRLDAVFEPFFSTKADSLGLGLFISLNIVQQHGGRIEVESREGHGTTFTIWLPLSSQRVDHSSRGSGAP